MDDVAVRVFTFSILPVIIAAGHLGLDRGSRRRERRLEIFLLYLFGIGAAGSGIGGFWGHFFVSDSVAQTIGWPTGNPFQLEVGFANLAVGIRGMVAIGRRDGLREATVIAASVFAVGATVVHVMDVAPPLRCRRPGEGAVPGEPAVSAASGVPVRLLRLGRPRSLETPPGR
jgi:hypothetical protein